MRQQGRALMRIEAANELYASRKGTGEFNPKFEAIAKEAGEVKVMYAVPKREKAKLSGASRLM